MLALRPITSKALCWEEYHASPWGIDTLFIVFSLNLKSTLEIIAQGCCQINALDLINFCNSDYNISNISTRNISKSCDKKIEVLGASYKISSPQPA